MAGQNDVDSMSFRRKSHRIDIVSTAAISYWGQGVLLAVQTEEPHMPAHKRIISFVSAAGIFKLTRWSVRIIRRG
jgi:hypothetical protein